MPLIIKFAPAFFTANNFYDSMRRNICGYVQVAANHIFENLNRVKSLINNPELDPVISAMSKDDRDYCRYTEYSMHDNKSPITYQQFQDTLQSKINVSDPKLLNFLTLLILQNYGGLQHTLQGKIQHCIADFNRDCISLDGNFNYSRSPENPSQFIRLITNVTYGIRFNNANSKIAARLNFIVDIDNNSLDLRVKSINLAIEDESIMGSIEEHLQSIGYVRVSDKCIQLADGSMLRAIEEARTDEEEKTIETKSDYHLVTRNCIEFAMDSLKEAARKSAKENNIESNRHRGNNIYIEPNEPVAAIEKIERDVYFKKKWFILLDDILSKINSLSKDGIREEDLSQNSEKAIKCLKDIVYKNIDELKNVIASLSAQQFNDERERIQRVLKEAHILIQGLYVRGDTKLSLPPVVKSISDKLNDMAIWLTIDPVFANLKGINTELSQRINNKQLSQKNNNEYYSVLTELHKIIDTICLSTTAISPFKAAKQLEQILYDIKCQKIEITQQINELKVFTENYNIIGWILDWRGIQEAKKTLTDLKSVYNHLGQIQQSVRESLGELNCQIYEAELNSKRQFGKHTKSSNNYQKYLTYQINRMYDGHTPPKFSFLDYLLPSRYEMKMALYAKYQIKQWLSDSSLTPIEQVQNITQLIESNKPKFWQFWLSTEEKINITNHYDHLSQISIYLCLFKAFSSGRFTEDNLLNQLNEFKQIYNIGNGLDIIIKSLDKKYKDNLKLLETDELKQLHQKRLSTTVKICQYLENQNPVLPCQLRDMKSEINHIKTFVQQSEPAKSQAIGEREVKEVTEDVIEYTRKVESRISGAFRVW